MRSPLSRAEFTDWLRREGQSRYHDRHPFHVRMHVGALSRAELKCWVENRYYYQTRIPIKDALIVSKSEDPRFRRAWLRRIRDHDGDREGEGGLAQWHRLADAVGIERAELADARRVLPGVRAACDSYVALVRDGSLLEAVAASLTETFAPDLMQRRIAAWLAHYPWVPSDALEYFRARVSGASRDGAEALEFVLGRARTHEEQSACVRALIKKTEILWALLESVQGASEVERWQS